jgi:hypothetical protein
MAEAKKSKQVSTTSHSISSGSSPIRSRLPVMPLAAILPAQGEASRLSDRVERFEERLLALQEEGPSASEEDANRRSSEESMLQQIVSWLRMGASS